MAKHAQIMIVDDHPLVREGLAARILAQPDLKVCAEASAVDEALALLRSSAPDLIIVDLALKNGHGLDLIKQVRQMGSHTRILVVSAYEESLYAERAMRAGADGYINKQEAQEEIIDAIRAVLRGERFLSHEMTQRLVGRAVGDKRRPEGVEGLSDREMEIFQLIGRGKSTRAIAEQLHLSIHTIESHRENIRAKLNLRNGSELVQHAVQWVLETR